MDYELMVPPFETKSFFEMNKKEAKEYFEWFIGNIPARIEQLKNTYEGLGGKSYDLDFSVNSLRDLWEWYIKNVEIIDKSEEEILKEKEELPEWLKKDVLTIKISTTWLAVAIDISMYLGEVLVRNNDKLEWGFVTKPKKVSHVNKPVIIGFKNDEMDVAWSLYIQTSKLLDGKNEKNALINLCNVWLEYL